MEVKRVQIGVYPSAKFVTMPKECVDDRTIVFTKLKMLLCFKDRRPFAVEYMKQLFPALGVAQSDKLLKWFYEEMPEYGYLEMDYGSGSLSFCLIEKK